MFALSSPESQELVKPPPKKEVEEPHIIDIFAENVEQAPETDSRAVVLDRAHQDDLRDVEGFYRYTPKELIQKTYQVTGLCGQGAYARVLAAERVKDHKLVAIKMIRRNDFQEQCAKEEVRLLEYVYEKDEKKQFPIIQLLGQFKHFGHKCLVFPLMEETLRDVITRTKYSGIKISLIRTYVGQIIKGLYFLQMCGLLHTDIKPENILVAGRTLKIGDLGSARHANHIERGVRLQSPYYRAPEITLGAEYSYPMDVWSAGCVFFELATSRVLIANFEPDNAALLDMMKIRGNFPKTFIKKADPQIRDYHFDHDLLQFQHRVFDRSTNSISTTVSYQQNKSPRNLRMEVTAGCYRPFKQNNGEDPNNAQKLLIEQFGDFLDKVLQLNPSKRIQPATALKEDKFLLNPNIGATVENKKRKKFP
ncbi:kinase-like protein [Aulographum hederae CBS 113979]|uniref:Kinase-like protein n=1 Tax=Aulographum hederae CBS 113979 TaxID=1176131 RepID=A0A6G1H2J8_9PEZI|nr:kinase-like protein [Aulographum hederae CBS 113979]